MRAIIFDCFGVLVNEQGVNPALKALVMEQLHGRVKLGILSNMNDNMVADLLGSELAACFDKILISGELGVGKPDQRAFMLAVGELKEFAEDCLLVDDSERNVAGAEAIGMLAIHFDTVENLLQKLKEYGIITP